MHDAIPVKMENCDCRRRLLVEFEAGYTPGLAFFAMQDELSRILERPVDLHTPNFLSRYFREQVVANAEV